DGDEFIELVARGLNGVPRSIGTKHDGKMAVTEEREWLFGQEKVLVRVGFREDVIVFVADGAVDKLGFGGNVQGTNRKIREIFSIGFGQNGTCPVDGAPRMRVELGRFV